MLLPPSYPSKKREAWLHKRKKREKKNLAHTKYGMMKKKKEEKKICSHALSKKRKKYEKDGMICFLTGSCL